VRAYSYRLMVLARRAKRTADIGTQKIRNLKFVHSTVLLNLTFIKLNIVNIWWMVVNISVIGDMQLSEIKSLAETAGAIANTLRLAIMLALRDMGKQSFNELLDAFQVNPNSLNYHLTKLLKADLIERERTAKETLEEKHSFYKITAKGEELLRSLGVAPSSG